MTSHQGGEGQGTNVMTADRAAHQEQAAQQQATQQSTISTQSQQSDHRTDNAQTAFAPEKSDAAAKTAPFAAKSAASIGRSISMATPGPSFTAPPASTTASASTTATPAPTQTPLGQRRGFVGAPLLHSPTTFRPDLAPALMSAPPQSTANPFGGVTGDHVGGSTSRPVTPAATSVMRSRAPSAGSTYGSVAAQFGVRDRWLSGEAQMQRQQQQQQLQQQQQQQQQQDQQQQQQQPMFDAHEQEASQSLLYSHAQQTASPYYFQQDHQHHHYMQSSSMPATTVDETRQVVQWLRSLSIDEASHAFRLIRASLPLEVTGFPPSASGTSWEQTGAPIISAPTPPPPPGLTHPRRTSFSSAIGTPRSGTPIAGVIGQTPSRSVTPYEEQHAVWGPQQPTPPTPNAPPYAIRPRIGSTSVSAAAMSSAATAATSWDRHALTPPPRSQTSAGTVLLGPSSEEFESASMAALQRRAFSPLAGSTLMAPSQLTTESHTAADFGYTASTVAGKRRSQSFGGGCDSQQKFMSMAAAAQARMQQSSTTTGQQQYQRQQQQHAYQMSTTPAPYLPPQSPLRERRGYGSPLPSPSQSPALGSTRHHQQHHYGPPPRFVPPSPHVEKGKIPEQIDWKLLNDVPAWLRSLRLHKYTSLFTGDQAHAPSGRRWTWQEMVRLTSDQLQSMGIEALGARRKLLKVFHMVRRALGEDIPESERLEDEEEASSGSPTVSTSEEAAVTKSVAEMSMSTPPQTPEKSGPAASIKN